MAHKVGILLTSGSLTGGGGSTGNTAGGVAANLAVEISNIKNTEGNILHQLADLKLVPVFYSAYSIIPASMCITDKLSSVTSGDVCRCLESLDVYHKL